MIHTTDVAVIGAGLAGISAAVAAARAGAAVTLVDEWAVPGGRARWSRRALPTGAGEFGGLRGVDLPAHALQALDDAGVGTEFNAIAWGLFEDRVIGVVTDSVSFRLQAGRIILATGSTDVVWPFPGWELPGVVTATAAQRLLNEHGVLPGRLAILVGSGELADELDDDLSSASIEVVARLADPNGLQVGGNGRVTWGEVNGARVRADCVVLAMGRQPDPELAMQGLCAIDYSPRHGAWVPRRSAALETSVPGVYVAGDAAGGCTAVEAALEGQLAGVAATGGQHLAQLQDALATARAAAPRRPDARPDAALIPDSVCVCRCEEVAAWQVRASVAEGALSVNDVKRRTRAGMGQCQGIYCVRTIAALINAQTGADLATLEPMTARPPARVIPLALLADAQP